MSDRVVHRIDDRDLRRACAQVGMFRIDADALLEQVRITRLDRELDEVSEQLRVKIEALGTPSRDVHHLLARHDEIDKLNRRWDRLSRERFERDPAPSGGRG